MVSIGKVYLYNGKPVYVTDGQYERGGRISNYWDFRYIKKDGNLGRKGGDYGGTFKAYTGKWRIKVLIK